MPDDADPTLQPPTAPGDSPGTALTAHPYTYRHHHRTEAALSGNSAPPTKVVDELPTGSKAARFNARFAILITNAVGTMWCAYVFFALALIGLPTALKPGGEGIIAWIAQTFLQLVLLSIIIVGQNIQAAASDKRAEHTYEDAEAILTEAGQIQQHLLTQDQTLAALIAEVQSRLSAMPGQTGTT